MYKGSLFNVPVKFISVDSRFTAYRSKFFLLVSPEYLKIDEFTHEVIQTWGLGFAKPANSNGWGAIRKYSDKASYVYESRNNRGAFNEIYLKPSALYDPNYLIQSDEFLMQVKNQYPYLSWEHYKEEMLETLSA
jgi:hypothetical protein